MKLSLKKMCMSILFVCVFPGWCLFWRIAGPPVNLSKSCCNRNNGKANHPTGTSWTPQDFWFREFHIIRNQTREKRCLNLKCCWLPFCGQRKWAAGTTPGKTRFDAFKRPEGCYQIVDSQQVVLTCLYNHTITMILVMFLDWWQLLYLPYN